jgi:hypothetical protein
VEQPFFNLPLNILPSLPKDPRLETTTSIGPEFTGKAKWYGGLLGCDGCIVSITRIDVADCFTSQMLTYTFDFSQ